MSNLPTVFKECHSLAIYSKVIKYLQKRKIQFNTITNYINGYGDKVILVIAKDSKLIPQEF